MNVLIVEDDNRIADLLERGLRQNGHEVLTACDGTDAVDLLVQGNFDAALLDVLLPGIDGLTVLEQVRLRRCKTPIMMLTAVDTVPKIVNAFDLGADDYLVKPFHLDILMARLGAIARRRQQPEVGILCAGDLEMDTCRRTVTRSGKMIHLTRKQFDLLGAMLRRSGLVTTREDLIEAGWGYLADIKPNTLDVYIHGLRTKLEVPGATTQILIRTVHGVGYRLTSE